MSAVVVTVYDKILSELSDLFPEKTRIPYPYTLEDNSNQFLANGYGIKLGGGNYEPLEWTSFTVSRTVSVVVTREVFRTDGDDIGLDDIVRGLLEDIHVIQKRLYGMDATSGNSVEVMKVDIGSVSGVEEVAAKSKFLSMEAEFTFQITDSF